MPEPETPLLLLDPIRVSYALCLPRDTTKRLIDSGAIPSVEVDGRVRVRLDDLVAWCESLKPGRENAAANAKPAGEGKPTAQLDTQDKGSD